MSKARQRLKASPDGMEHRPAVRLQGGEAALICAMVAGIPILMRVIFAPLEGPSTAVYGVTRIMDMFSMIKAQAFLLGAGGLLLLSLARALMEGRSHRLISRPYLISIALFALVALLASIHSPYKRVAILGAPQRCEGLLVWLGYALIFVVCAARFNSVPSVMTYLGALRAGAFVVFSLGLLQLCRFDYYNLPFVKRLLIPAKELMKASTFQLTLPDKIHATLLNPNYLASYCAILLPVAVGFCLEARSRRQKIVSFAFLLLAWVNCLGTFSTLGYVAAAVSLSCWAFYAILHASCRRRLACIALVLGATLAVVQISSGRRVTAQFAEASRGGLASSQVGAHAIEGIVAEGAGVRLKTSAYEIRVVQAEGYVSIQDVQGQEIPFVGPDDAGEFHPQAEGYPGLSARFIPERSRLTLKVGAKEVPLVMAQDQVRLMRVDGSPMEAAKPASLFFSGREAMGSGRGYVWSRSLPLILRSWALGYGPDTLAYVFPQGDAVGKLKAWDTPLVVVDRPHSLYLQMALGFGLPGLTLFLILMGLYGWDSLKTLILMRDIPEGSAWGMALFAGVLAYLAAGLFCDSDINVGPVFWCTLGVGVAWNRWQGLLHPRSVEKGR